MYLRSLLHLRLGRSTVTIAAGRVRIARRGVLLTRREEHAAGDFRGVVAAKGMEGGGWSLELARRERETVTPGEAVRDRREAEWIAQQMSRALSAAADQARPHGDGGR